MENTRTRDTVDDNSGVLARTTMAMALIVAAVAALAITSLSPTHRATAQPPAVAQAAPTAATIPMSAPLDSRDVGPFAFGYLVFDWDPRAPGGVPGFDTWPPSGRR